MANQASLTYDSVGIQALSRRALHKPPRFWDSGSIALTMPRGSCGATYPTTPSDVLRFTHRLCVPVVFRRWVSALTQKLSSEFLHPAGGIWSAVGQRNGSRKDRTHRPALLDVKVLPDRRTTEGSRSNHRAGGSPGGRAA